MRRSLGVLLLALPLATAAAPVPERVSFPSLAPVPASATRIGGLLFVPEGATPASGRPAVIALHGCGGLYRAATAARERLSERHAAYVRAWLAEGYAVLLPDSFGARGRREICTQAVRERTITIAQRRLDVLGALDWLARQADIDPTRIALVGWSHGGSTVLATIDAAGRDLAALRAGDDAAPFFRTAIALYPGCGATLRNPQWRPAISTAILIGAADDWTPAPPCEALATRARAAGWPLEVVVYPDAHHGFDAPRGEMRLRTDVAGGARPGAGVHVGPDPSAREHAGAKVRAALRAALRD